LTSSAHEENTAKRLREATEALMPETARSVRQYLQTSYPDEQHPDEVVNQLTRYVGNVRAQKRIKLETAQRGDPSSLSDCAGTAEPEADGLIELYAVQMRLGDNAALLFGTIASLRPPDHSEARHVWQHLYDEISRRVEDARASPHADPAAQRVRDADINSMLALMEQNYRCDMHACPEQASVGNVDEFEIESEDEVEAGILSLENVFQVPLPANASDDDKSQRREKCIVLLQWMEYPQTAVPGFIRELKPQMLACMLDHVDRNFDALSRDSANRDANSVQGNLAALARNKQTLENASRSARSNSEDDCDRRPANDYRSQTRVVQHAKLNAWAEWLAAQGLRDPDHFHVEYIEADHSRGYIRLTTEAAAVCNRSQTP
jgi:hypothetical protein